jgi:hypothetical protein
MESYVLFSVFLNVGILIMSVAGIMTMVTNFNQIVVLSRLASKPYGERVAVSKRGGVKFCTRL